MKLSALIIDADGNPSFRLEPPPPIEPMPRKSMPLQKSSEAMRQMVQADDTNRANAHAWMQWHQAQAEAYEHHACAHREAERRLADALSEVAA